MKEKICRAVNELKDELVRVVSDTVKIPSVTPGFPDGNPDGESKVNSYMEKVMRDAGLETDLWAEEKGRLNLAGVYQGGAGKSLLFNGHVDVVPTGPEAAWGRNPWSGAIADGRIWGRGSADMKGGNAAAVFAFKALKKAGFSPKGDIVIQHVVGEECKNTEAGTGSALKRGYRADAGIVVEPTTWLSPLTVCPASPGVAAMLCTVEGKPVHSCMRDDLVRPGGLGSEVGVHAIDKGMVIYNAMKALEEEWGQTKSHPLFKRPGHFVIHTGSVAGGSGGSVVADRMVWEYSFWHTPQENLKTMQQEVEEHIARHAATDPWLREHMPKVEWVFHWPAYDLPADSPICTVLSQTAKSLDETCGDLYGFPAVDDAVFLNQAGIPTVSFGPGNLRNAHTFNESLDINELLKATQIYALAIAEWCGV